METCVVADLHRARSILLLYQSVIEFQERHPVGGRLEKLATPLLAGSKSGLPWVLIMHRDAGTSLSFFPAHHRHSPLACGGIALLPLAGGKRKAKSIR